MRLSRVKVTVEMMANFDELVARLAREKNRGQI